MVDSNATRAHINATTGMRMGTTAGTVLSSEAGEAPRGKVYKFNQIGPDGLTSQNQHGPPSSYWKEDHVLPPHLLKTPEI